MNHPKVPKQVTYQSALEVVVADAHLKQLISIYEQLLAIKGKEAEESGAAVSKQAAFDTASDFALVSNKIEAGKIACWNYRCFLH